MRSRSHGLTIIDGGGSGADGLVMTASVGLSRSVDCGEGQEVSEDRQPAFVALIDESTPVAGAGVYYVMTTAVVMDVEAAREGLESLFVDTPGRKRPFHWHKEGPIVQERMMQLIIDLGVVTFCRWRTVGRRGQTSARRELLVALANDVVAEGVTELIIEQGDHRTNRRDQMALLDHYRDRGGVPFKYGWRGKDEPLLWLPDAIGGATSAYLLNQNPSWYERLREAGVVPPEPTSM
jgi:hypothetical protein